MTSHRAAAASAQFRFLLAFPRCSLRCSYVAAVRQYRAWMRESRVFCLISRSGKKGSGCTPIADVEKRHLGKAKFEKAIRVPLALVQHWFALRGDQAPVPIPVARSTSLSSGNPSTSKILLSLFCAQQVFHCCTTSALQ